MAGETVTIKALGIGGSNPLPPEHIAVLKREIARIKLSGGDDRAIAETVIGLAGAYAAGCLKAAMEQLAIETGVSTKIGRELLGGGVVWYPTKNAAKTWRLRHCPAECSVWFSDTAIDRERCALEPPPREAISLSEAAYSLVIELAYRYPHSVYTAEFLDVLARRYRRLDRRKNPRPDKLLKRIRAALGKEARRLERRTRGIRGGKVGGVYRFDPT